VSETLDLNALMMFEEVVKAGSLAAACERLGVPRSTLSRRLLNLEKQMGLMLLKKNTRRLAPSEFGLHVHAHCERIAAELAAIREKSSRSKTELDGTLRVALPIEFGTRWLGRAISEFAVAYPQIVIEIDASGRAVDLIEDAFDVVISVGKPKPSMLTQRRLGSLTAGIYASPSYVERCGLPRSLPDLEQHDCVVTEIQLREGSWRLRGPRGVRAIGVRGRVRVNNVRLARELVVGGTALGLLPHLMCVPHVRSGALVRVLPSWNSPALPIVALLISRSAVPKKTQTFLNFIAEQLATVTGSFRTEAA
jgi:DNA-binding transcriptional LysR family regulator